MRLSPDNLRKWRRFRQNRLAWFSLLALTGLFFVVLPAELLCNDRPLAVRCGGRWFSPALFVYAGADFGLPSGSPEPDYRRWAAPPPPSRQPVTPSPSLPVFDSEPGELPPSPPRISGSAGAPFLPSSPWMVWAPVRHGYASIASGSRSGRDALAAPYAIRDRATGAVTSSSWADGHWLGTDDRGRDVLARLIYGLRLSMLFGLTVAVISVVVGTVLGGIQGFFGGWTDLLGQRFTEIWGSLPRLYLLMILSTILSRGIGVLLFIMVLTSWMGIAAYMRAEFLRGRNLEYVRAARALGAENAAIMFRHILPNSLTPLVTFFPFMVSGGVLALTSLDFLGLGVPSPQPSLGELLTQGQANLQALWIIVPTFLVLCVTTLMLTFVGDGLRNAFDPRKC